MSAPAPEKTNEEWRELTGPNGRVMQNWCIACDHSYRLCQCGAAQVLRIRFRGDLLPVPEGGIRQVASEVASKHAEDKR